VESDVSVTATGPDAAGIFSVAVTIQGIDHIAAVRLAASLRAMTAARIATALGAPSGSVTTSPEPTVTLEEEAEAEEGAEGAEEGGEEEEEEGVPRIAWAVPRLTSVRPAVAAATAAAAAAEAEAGAGEASAARPRSLFEDLLNCVAVGALLSLVAAYSMGYYS
jgi:hypothetical protein